MKKYSWYSKVAPRIPYSFNMYQYAVDRYRETEYGTILYKKGCYVIGIDGGWSRYKPNRKGGHTHNHKSNAVCRSHCRGKCCCKREECCLRYVLLHPLCD